MDSSPQVYVQAQIGLAAVLADCHAQPNAHSKSHYWHCFAETWLSGAASSKLVLRIYLAHVCRHPLDFLLLTHCSQSAKKSVHIHLLLLTAGKVLGCLVL